MVKELDTVWHHPRNLWEPPDHWRAELGEGLDGGGHVIKSALS